jgi:uncharacterized protein (TIGR01244 family)
MNNMRKLSGLLVALISLAGCAGLLGERTEPTLEKSDVPGITNFTQLNDGGGFAGELVGFGGATAPESMTELRAAGFATVINLRLAAERGADVDASRAAAEAAGLKYVHLPYNPANAPPEILDEFIAAIGNRGGQPLYIHCASATRVAGMWMAARVLVDGWDVDAAAGEAAAIAGRPERAVEVGRNLLESKLP